MLSPLTSEKTNDDASESPNKSLAKRALARKMALAGYATKIIVIETSLTDKQVRREYSLLEESGYQFRDIKKGAFKSSRKKSGTILSSQLSKQHASLLIKYYWSLVGEAALTNVKVIELTKAYSMYCATINEMSKFSTTVEKSILSISDAWCLASDLRSNEAYITKCNNRKCGSSYISSINQVTMITCPFCPK